MAPRARSDARAKGKRPAVESPPVTNPEGGESSRPRRSTRITRMGPEERMEETLRTSQVLPTRFIDWNVANRLGLSEGLDEMFGTLGIQTYMRREACTYAEETFQFLRTMVVSQDHSRIEFTVNGRTAKLTIHDVRAAYQFEEIPTGELIPGSDAGMRDLWRILAESSTTSHFAPGTSKASGIRNPLLRFAQRALGDSFFGRDKTGPVLREEWRMLCSFVHTLGHEFDPAPQFIQLLDPAHIMLAHLRSYQDTLRQKMPGEGRSIRIGGVITPLLIRGEVPLGEPLGEILYLDERILRRCDFIGRARDDWRYRYTVGRDVRRMLLPCSSRVPLRDRANLLFLYPDGTTVPGSVPAPGPDTVHQHQHQTTAPGPDIWETIERELGPVDGTEDDLDAIREWQSAMRSDEQPDMIHRVIRQQGRTFSRILRGVVDRMRRFERQLGCGSRHTDAVPGHTGPAPARASDAAVPRARAPSRRSTSAAASHAGGDSRGPWESVPPTRGTSNIGWGEWPSADGMSDLFREIGEQDDATARQRSPPEETSPMTPIEEHVCTSDTADETETDADRDE